MKGRIREKRLVGSKYNNKDRGGTKMTLQQNLEAQKSRPAKSKYRNEGKKSRIRKKNSLARGNNSTAHKSDSLYIQAMLRGI